MQRSRSNKQEDVSIMSIDLGMKNFSFGIERRNSDDDIEGFPELNGTMVMLKNVCVCSQQEIVQLLDSYFAEIAQCQSIVIENQVRANSQCIKLQQHLATYFMLRHPVIHVYFFPAHQKIKRFLDTHQTLSAMTYRDRKKFAVEKCLEILHDRGENETLDMIAMHTKKDDMADVFLQLQAFKTVKRTRSSKLK